MQTVTLSLFRFGSIARRLWVVAQMGAARFDFARMDEVGFWKLCGSGVGEGFTPLPNTHVWAILATWPDEECARWQIDNAPVYRRWRDHADETFTLFLTASSARGQWSGVEPFDVTGPQGDGPIAAMTRATLKPRIAAQFWRHVPNISAAIGTDPNVIFKIGVGEVPLIHQVTFSIWPDAASMAAFARADGPHARAIRAVRDGNWFREELYARFRILGTQGTWDGRSPLPALERTAA